MLSNVVLSHRILLFINNRVSKTSKNRLSRPGPREHSNIISTVGSTSVDVRVELTLFSYLRLYQVSTPTTVLLSQGVGHRGWRVESRQNDRSTVPSLSTSFCLIPLSVLRKIPDRSLQCVMVKIVQNKSSLVSDPYQV